MPIALTTTYKKIKAVKEPITLIQGGMGAGKNFAMAILLLERQDARIITVLANSYDYLKDGIITDYEKIFLLSGLNFYDFYNKQDKVLTWGKSKIQFRYIVDHKPYAGKSKRREILYINEANMIGWNAAQHYISRSKEIYMDFNPDQEFWAHKELLPRDDCRRIVVTYQDNEMCPENEVRYIESRRHKTEWFKVYGLGLTGTFSERRVYNFEVIDVIPPHAKKLPRGMDFGHSPDPTCLIDVYIDGINLYLDEIFQENNLLPEEVPGAIDRPCISDRMDTEALRHARVDLPDILFDKDEEFYLKYDPYTSKEVLSANDKKIIDSITQYRQWLIIADSAGAKEIRDLKRRGYNVRGVKKKKGSIGIGIARLQSYDIKITQRSLNIKAGMEKWLRKEDQNGKITSEPVGHEPDTLAASRYVMLGKALW